MVKHDPDDGNQFAEQASDSSLANIKRIQDRQQQGGRTGNAPQKPATTPAKNKPKQK